VTDARTELFAVETTRLSPKDRAAIARALRQGIVVIAVLGDGRRKPVQQVWPQHFPQRP